jgi:hypothetical protein
MEIMDPLFLGYQLTAGGVNAGNFDEVEPFDPCLSQGLFKAGKFFLVLAFSFGEE